MFVLGETPLPETLESANKLIEEIAKERDDFKKHSRDWEDKAKANKDAAPKLTEAEKALEKAHAEIEKLKNAADAGKSEVEKQLAKQQDALDALTKRAEAAEAAAAADKLTALKTRIGSEKKLPTAIIDLLKGEDEETIAAHADELLAALPAPPKIPGVPGQGGGGTPSTKLTVEEAGALPMADYLKARDEGRIEGA